MLASAPRKRFSRSALAIAAALAAGLALLTPSGFVHAGTALAAGPSAGANA